MGPDAIAPRMKSSHSIRAQEELRSAYLTGGVRGALQHLNGRTPHRFTSLYRFEGDMLRNVTFFDRQNPDQAKCEDIPVAASYCVFVRDSGTRFVVQDSWFDEQVRDHSKRKVVQCYCGVPLVDRDGRMFGSICHFDVKPGIVSRDDIELLEYMADLLRESDALSNELA